MYIHGGQIDGLDKEVSVLGVEIAKDRITPYLEELEDKMKGSSMRSFLDRQYPVLTKNISDCFRKKIYRTDSGIKKWQSLKPETVRRRKRAGTWKGGNSILFETGRMWYGSWSNKRVTGKSKVYTLYLSPASSQRQKFMRHQYTGVGKAETTRPPYSILKSTERILINKTINYFWK